MEIPSWGMTEGERIHLDKRNVWNGGSKKIETPGRMALNSQGFLLQAGKSVGKVI
jgi:hypothetical protein